MASVTMGSIQSECDMSLLKLVSGSTLKYQEVVNKADSNFVRMGAEPVV